MASDYESKKNKLAEELKRIKQEFLELKEAGGEAFQRDAEHFEETALDFYKNFKTKANEGLEEVKKKVPEYKEAIREQFSKAGEEVSSTVKKNPIEALSVAGALGLIAGFLLSRK
ncbi:MAG: hypothetical protein WDW19_01220 [Neisseriaceae bacterium]